jgi:hypothetical protein
LIFITVLVLGRILEKLLSLSSFEGSHLVRISNSWLPGVVCPAEALPFLSSIPCCKDVIDLSCPSWIPKWLQGEWLRAKIGTKIEAWIPSPSPGFS